MKTTTKVAGVIGALTATILGTYFYAKTPKGKKQLAEVKSKAGLWANQAKRDILKHIKDLKEVDQKNYHKVVDTVVKKYKAAKKLAPKEVNMVTKELKKHWKNAKKEITKLNKKIKDDLVG